MKVSSYEKEVKRQFGDITTYKQLDSNQFPGLVRTLNETDLSDNLQLWEKRIATPFNLSSALAK